MFKLASPSVRSRFSTANERALYTFVKERKFGAGCVDDWLMGAAALAKRTAALLEPSSRTLEKTPFLFGDRPTFADAALFGQVAMLAGADLRQLAALPAPILTWFRRMQEKGASDPTEAPPTIRPRGA
jgi:glutathione S-transferase